MLWMKYNDPAKKTDEGSEKPIYRKLRAESFIWFVIYSLPQNKSNILRNQLNERNLPSSKNSYGF